MAIPKIKATYSLDADTVRVLEQAAKRWGISKSEALRRAIRGLTVARGDAESALDALQTAANLSSAEANRWAKNVRAERRADRTAVPRKAK
jgi:Arc/MetJ-type ribon-helix-helix transcriptional regulator